MEISLNEYELKIHQFLYGLRTSFESNKSIYKKKLNLFFDELSFRNDLFKHFKNQADKQLSSDFNVFNVINPDENKLSDILADILDTHGSHGQGNLFLNEFISFLINKKLKIQFDNYRVLREVSANGRIDILLEGDNFALIIENKPFAIDQVDQINRYYDSMIQKYNDNVAVLYLNKTESNPQNFSDKLKEKQIINLSNNKKLLVIAYLELNDYLTICLQKCESNKFRFFLTDFVDYININFTHFEGENDDTTKQI